METTDKFLSDITTFGGSTVSVVTGQREFKEGFFVSLKQFSEVHSLESYNDVILEFIAKNSNELKKENRFLGGWIDDNNLYLNISTLILDKRTALETAYKNEKLAIYDNLNKTVISLPTKQRSGTYTQQSAYLTSVIDRLCK